MLIKIENSSKLTFFHFKVSKCIFLSFQKNINLHLKLASPGTTSGYIIKILGITEKLKNKLMPIYNQDDIKRILKLGSIIRCEIKDN